MALDKLVDSTQLDNNLTSVANAIRAKSGGTGQLAFPAGFVSEIGNISGGGITPTGTKEITISKNGTITEDVTNYASAAITVNVPSQAAEFTGDDYLARYKSTDDFVSQTQKTWTGFGFGANFAARGVRLMAATGEWNQYALQSLLNGNTKIKYFVAPLLNSCSVNMAKSATALLGVDVGAVNIYSTAFSGCTALNVLVLRRTAGVCALANINAFTNSPFASGKAGGTLYVPQSLLASYQSAANWSTILGYSTNSIQPIEGSIYETQYVDGTPIA